MLVFTFKRVLSNEFHENFHSLFFMALCALAHFPNAVISSLMM
jgi:hypothetical protein